MTAAKLRRTAYRLAAALALGYTGYVVVLKLTQRVMGGPLGEVGEFLWVLAAVTAFAVGLFADESDRKRVARNLASGGSMPTPAPTPISTSVPAPTTPRPS